MSITSYFARTFILIYSKTIQKLSALVLFFVFALGSTPKLFLHNALANHTDSGSSCKHADGAKPCVHESGFNCHFDSLVVNTAFTATVENTFEFLSTQFNIADRQVYHFCYKPSWFSFKDYRGPPLSA